MNSLIPVFDFQRMFVLPWTHDLPFTGSWMLMGFLVTAACGLVGNYLMLRRMALMGDAVSHSVLPGLVIAFLFTGSRGTGAMFLGALLAGVATTVIIETIHRKTRVKQDASIGVTFTTLFAIGVVLVSVYSSQVDLDAECVLYGEIGYIPAITGWGEIPEAILRMGGVLVVVTGLIGVFYKELLVSSFDAGLARSLGINTTAVHYGMMIMLSVVVVSAFEAVGSILVVAMLILPGATAGMLSTRLAVVHGLSVVHAALSAVLGFHLSLVLGSQIGPAMVVAGAGLFGIAWVFSPTQGLLRRWFRRPVAVGEPVV
ncbi:ABC transporter [Nibricoccus aquaticus]|uniref:ABC transporter n=1 Tax=Nibricoccus aquaticus TaxID=2576891 RepID=A0A290Q322_9BACT|nr:metal ABC transporter permease [Nibricoccus aquaticus]ATC62904.1 ABC transporter [Nibricoccus aquaticus]